jgi:hypothetical protein
LLLVALVPLARPSVAFSTMPAVQYETSSTAVVASLREVVGEMADPDPGPSIQIFGDGRLQVHFPPYMRRAGDWSDQLSADEMQVVLGALVADGLLDLDPAAARANLTAARSAARTAARRGEAPLLEASDTDVTTITLDVEGRSQTIVWRGLRGDAFAHPDVPEVQQARRAQETLRLLMERPRLRRVR